MKRFMHDGNKIFASIDLAEIKEAQESEYPAENINRKRSSDRIFHGA